MAGRSKRLPEWLSRPIPRPGRQRSVARILVEGGLETVCENARCPNRGECYGGGTATFMILGNVCSRSCRFCAVAKGTAKSVDPGEPGRVAHAAAEMELDYVVVTSVTRDDLDDGGAGHFAATVNAVRLHNRGCRVEVLTPDFQGSPHAIEAVVRAAPDVYNHNVETVPRLYTAVRPLADFDRSLDLLRLVKKLDPGMVTKSGIMVGVGESRDELLAALAGLREVGCDAVTIGQYLQAAQECLPVDRYVPPSEFRELELLAREMGFAAVASGPLIRSSYKAADLCPPRNGAEESA